MNKFIKLMVILSTFSLSIDAKLFRVYNLNHKGVKQYLVSAVRRYSTKRDAIKFVWCDMAKKDDIYVFWFTYSSYRHLLDDGKSYGVTYIDSIPMFLYGKRYKNILQKRNQRITIDVFHPHKFPLLIFDPIQEKIELHGDTLKVYRYK